MDEYLHSLFPDEPGRPSAEIATLIPLLLIALALSIGLAFSYTTLVDPATRAEISARNGASGAAMHLSADNPRLLPPISPERQAEYNRILHDAFAPRD